MRLRSLLIVAVLVLGLAVHFSSALAAPASQAGGPVAPSQGNDPAANSSAPDKVPPWKRTPTPTPRPPAPTPIPPSPTPYPTAVPSGRQIMSGVAIEGVPWDMSKLTTWEQNVSGKALSIVHYWVFWKQNGVYQRFVSSLLESVRNHGSIPMITWSPEALGGGVNQPDFQLIDIINGVHDDYIRNIVSDVKAWGKPLFVRFAQEPDGNWFPWGEDANGNQRGQYVLAWKHVHDLFTAAGATNISWVWCPNVTWQYSPRPSYASLYPGDSYVDWSCLDGYNWGTNYPSNGEWITFDQVFHYSYDAIGQVTSKPLMLGEWASSETGGSKSAWITDALSTQIPYNFPRIKATVWYNTAVGDEDWRVESSAASTSAWRSAISSPNWLGAQFGGLTTSPIPAP